MNHNKLSFIFCLALAASTILIGWQTPSLADSAGQPPIADTARMAADSTMIAAQTTTTIGGIKIPQAVITIVLSLMTLLPAIQLVLKRIPTTSSVKITGVVGKVLDVLTIFQGDCKTGGGTHDKPDPSGAVKKV